MINTYDATWVRKYYAKGHSPQIAWTKDPAQHITDTDINGFDFFWPDTAILPDGEQVPRWRFFGAMMVFGAIRSFQSKAPILYYLSFESPQIELSRNDYLYKYPNALLPLQPDLGYSEAEINSYFDTRL